MLALFSKVPKIQHPKALKIDIFRLPHYRLTPLSPGNSREYPHKAYIARNYAHWATSSPPTV